MKKLIFYFLLGLVNITVNAQSSDITGDWSGKLNVYGTELALVFHLDSVNCTLDSPDQGIKGVPAKMERTATGIKVSIASINASYEGVNMGDSIMGTFKQHGQSADTCRPLSLSDAGGEFQEWRCRAEGNACHARRLFTPDSRPADGHG